MKLYNMIDGETDSFVGTLLYYENADAFIIELADDLDEWSAPLLFTAFVKKNVFTIPREAAAMWVRERIIPSGRQNIQEILKTHHLKEYSEIRFVELSSGKSSQDNVYIKKADVLPAFAIERQKKNLTEAVMLNSFRMLCFFQDGTAKLVDMTDFHNEYESDKILRNEQLFLSGELGAGGYYVTFNNSIDIPAWYLYNVGIDLPLSPDDFRSFVNRNVLSTAESCCFLQCSRQNLFYLANQQQVQPVKQGEKVTLYLKGDLHKTTW